VLKTAKDFPALTRAGRSGETVVFADAPGGTQVPEPVIAAVEGHWRYGTANLGGVFETSIEADEVVSAARSAAADLLGATPGEVFFGANATTLLYSLSRALARNLTPGDHVVVTRLDHDANITPWVTAAREAGASVDHLDLDPDGCSLRPADLADIVTPRTRIVAFTLASNAVGSITAAEELVRVAHLGGAIVVGDAVHLMPHRAIDVAALGIDLLVCSAYKFFGPHVGVMFGRQELLEERAPYRLEAQSQTVPERWETGTQNVEGLAGLVAAVQYLASLAPEAAPTRRASLMLAMNEISVHEASLSRAFLDGILSLPRVRGFGEWDLAAVGCRTPTFALRIEGLPSRRAAELLAERGIFVWDGDFYAPALLSSLGPEAAAGLVRVGFCHYNTLDDVSRVLEALAWLDAVQSRR
jgi:cysteine desulfurase family protein (TIGR01976 family)